MVTQLFMSFAVLKGAKLILESWLAAKNRAYYRDIEKQSNAKSVLGIADGDFAKILAYTEDKYSYGMFSSWLNFIVLIAFIACGGFKAIEQIAIGYTAMKGGGPIFTGLLVLSMLGFLNFLYSIPFDIFTTFKIEGKHGFNRQTPKSFFVDKVKEIILSLILGVCFLLLVLYAMEAGTYWWFWAWVTTTVFSLLVSWLYPAFLAPLFNKFRPLPEGELRDQIYALAQKIDFKTGGISVMDASSRSTHGNAYFTGIFGEKKIVLFDTLVDSLTPKEIVAVLAHELGHFKLNHVGWSLARSIFIMGALFFVLSLCKPIQGFYEAFGFSQVSNYGALIVFSLWYGIVGFIFTPLQAWLSQKNEFAADAFAKKNMGGYKELSEALIKLQKKNQSMPLTHPIFSRIYYSHPPLLERLAVLKKN